ncbi:MAG: hypothetical protein AMXMBFR58_23090 [Phycisphaerae bacterium]
MNRVRRSMFAGCLALLVAVTAMTGFSQPAQTDSRAQPGEQPAATSPAEPGAPTLPLAPAADQPPQPAPTPDPLPANLPFDLEHRLAELRPGNPEGYLRLGEDVAAAATDNLGRGLARRLYTLAFVLDRRRANTSVWPTATSACLALAELATTQADRQWLEALARSIDRRLAVPEWTTAAQDPVDSATAYLATVFVGLVRSGDTIRAERVLAQPGVRDVIRRYERLLSPYNQPGGLAELEREMTRWPCPECAGKRVVRRFQSNPPQFRLCSVCRGTLGPDLSPQTLSAQLRFESRLLAGTARSWAAQVISDDGAPLRDVDPGELPGAMGVDPSLVIWRDGRWVAESSANLP